MRSMSRSMRVTVDAAKVSPSRVIRESAGLAPLTVVSVRMLIELSDELGGHEAAGMFLLSVAEDLGRPIGVNVPTLDGNSRSMFLAPKGWSQERLAGWVAGRHQEIETAFGPATPVKETDG